MRLDPALVRPEAVTFFEEVRARHHNELLAAYRQGRPRYYMGLNLLPLVGQIQNREWKKLAIIGALDAAFLATSLTTGSLLEEWQGSDHTFKGHQGAYKPLFVIDSVGFAALLGVTLYGITDGFIVGARRQRAERERESEARLGY